MNKKTITVLLAIPFLIIQCNDKKEGNKSVIKTEEVSKTITNENGTIDSTLTINKTIKEGNNEVQENTYRYVATDGNSALVTFKTGSEGNSISVNSNKKTISAPQTEKTPKESIYKKEDIEIRAKGDSVTIIQGENIIELRKAKGQ